MPFLTKVGSALKNAVKGGAKAKAVETATDTATDEEKRKKLLVGAGVGTFGCLIFPIFGMILAFSYLFGTIQIADGATITGSGGSGNLIYGMEELEKYYQASEEARPSGNPPAADLASTTYQSVDGFNQHIKSSVETAGYGTRAGVVAAGVALIGDYIAATGKRLRYNQDLRQPPFNDGIVNQNFYMDCSSFAWWSVYNGGFKKPSEANTGAQNPWAEKHGYIKDSSAGQAGDFLISSGHIVLIIGIADDNNYYIAHFSGSAAGAKIDKKSKNASGYRLIDMETYYNDPNNKR